MAGLKPQIWVGHCYQPPHHDKVYVVWINNKRVGDNPFEVLGGYERRDSPKQLRMQPIGQFSSFTGAEHAMQKAIREKSKKYMAVEEYDYKSTTPASVHFTVADAMKRIDTTRLVGHSVGTEVGEDALTLPTIGVTTKKVQHKAGRADRSLEL